MGGPLGRWKIKKYGLKPLTSEVEQNANLGEPETVYQTKAEMLNSETFLTAFVFIIIATGLGTYVTNAFASINIVLPVYIGGMVVALIIRNIADAMGKELPLKAIDVAGNTSLNVFLGIALMTLMLWQLAALALPIVVILAVQTLLMYLYASFVVFPAMGKDYEAAVMTAAICGRHGQGLRGRRHDRRHLRLRHGRYPQRHGQHAGHQEPVRPGPQGLLRGASGGRHVHRLYQLRHHHCVHQPDRLIKQAFNSKRGAPSWERRAFAFDFRRNGSGSGPPRPPDWRGRPNRRRPRSPGRRWPWPRQSRPAAAW